MALVKFVKIVPKQAFAKADTKIEVEVELDVAREVPDPSSIDLTLVFMPVALDEEAVGKDGLPFLIGKQKDKKN